MKRAIEKGNLEGARIYAQNAIRKKTEQLNYLKVRRNRPRHHPRLLGGATRVRRRRFTPARVRRYHSRGVGLRCCAAAVGPPVCLSD